MECCGCVISGFGWFVVCCVCWFVDGALGMPRLFLFDCLFNIYVVIIYGCVLHWRLYCYGWGCLCFGVLVLFMRGLRVVWLCLWLRCSWGGLMFMIMGYCCWCFLLATDFGWFGVTPVCDLGFYWLDCGV